MTQVSRETVDEAVRNALQNPDDPLHQTAMDALKSFSSDALAAQGGVSAEKRMELWHCATNARLRGGNEEAVPVSARELLDLLSALDPAPAQDPSREDVIEWVAQMLDWGEDHVTADKVRSFKSVAWTMPDMSDGVPGTVPVGEPSEGARELNDWCSYDGENPVQFLRKLADGSDDALSRGEVEDCRTLANHLKRLDAIRPAPTPQEGSER